MARRSGGPDKAAKGRPVLSWAAKRPLREVRAFPAVHPTWTEPVAVQMTEMLGEEIVVVEPR